MRFKKKLECLKNSNWSSSKPSFCKQRKCGLRLPLCALQLSHHKPQWIEGSVLTRRKPVLFCQNPRFTSKKKMTGLQVQNQSALVLKVRLSSEKVQTQKLDRNSIKSRRLSRLRTIRNKLTTGLHQRNHRDQQIFSEWKQLLMHNNLALPPWSLPPWTMQSCMQKRSGA